MIKQFILINNFLGIVLSQYAYSSMFFLYTGVPESHISSFCKVSRDDIILTGMEV